MARPEEEEACELMSSAIDAAKEGDKDSPVVEHIRAVWGPEKVDDGETKTDHSKNVEQEPVLPDGDRPGQPSEGKEFVRLGEDADREQGAPVVPGELPSITNETGLLKIEVGKGNSVTEHFDPTLSKDHKMLRVTQESDTERAVGVVYRGREDKLDARVSMSAKDGSSQTIFSSYYEGRSDGLLTEEVSISPNHNGSARKFDPAVNPDHLIVESENRINCTDSEIERSFRNHPADMVSETVETNAEGKRKTQVFKDGTRVVTFTHADGAVVVY
jgi:hypothetical protein